MKRWIGAAGLSGLTVLLGVVGSADAASAAPGGNGPPSAPPGSSGRTPPAAATGPARGNSAAAAPGKPTPSARPASSNRPSSPTRATGQERAAQVRTVPPAAAARSNRPGSPNRATGQDRAAQVRSSQAVAGRAASAAAVTAAPVAAPATPAAPVAATQAGKVTICHSTGSATSPFELIEIANPAAQAHLGHGDVAPVGGVCPGAVATPTPGQPATICHRTSSDTNPFEVITIPDSALPAHLAHGDVATVDGACPGVLVLGVQLVAPVVRPGVRTAVLGSVREAVAEEAQSLSEIVPLARTTERARNLGRGTNGGSLPKTGTDVGSAVLLGLLLLLVGGRMARSGKLRMTAPTALATASTAPTAGVPASRLPSVRAMAPPLLRGRRTP